jgi:hypothetical protein
MSCLVLIAFLSPSFTSLEIIANSSSIFSLPPFPARLCTLPPSNLGHYPAVCLSFLVSGLVHDAIFWMLQADGQVNGKWLIFFSLQVREEDREGGVVGWGES